MNLKRISRYVQLRESDESLVVLAMQHS